MNKLLIKLSTILFCILLPMFLILFSYKAALFFADLDIEQQKTINFLRGKEDLTLNYTALERSHLEDVKTVINWCDYLFYFSLLCLTLILTYHNKNKEQIRRLLFYGGIATVAVLAIILLFSLLSFNSAFILFHNLFFPQGNWTFSSDSLLIQTFPLGFFIGMSYKIIIQSLIYGIIFILLYFSLKHAHSSPRL